MYRLSAKVSQANMSGTKIKLNKGTKCIIFMIRMCEESRNIVFLNDISYIGQDRIFSR